MANARLQLMVYGENVAGVRSVTTNYPGTSVEEIVRLDSSDYLFVYLDLTNAKPGIMQLSFDGTMIPYELRKREKEGVERQGFTNADVIYLLLPDRFAQGRGHRSQINELYSYVEDRTQPSLRHGGDLNGIREHLDYFCQLGVTALWLTPVLENNAPDDPRGFSSYHGYAITNYYRVDPRLGTFEEYRKLVDEAHLHGLKIIMDMVFNHCGVYHPWLSNIPSKDWINGKSDSYVWKSAGIGVQDDKTFLQTNYKLTTVLDPYASEIDKKETIEGWFVSSMPDLNLRNPHLLRYLIQNSKWWIETIGIDGIRMDTYPYADSNAMDQWMREIDVEYPNFNVVGETWVTEPAFTAAWQNENHHLKTVMDFSFYDKVDQAVKEETDEWWQGLNRIYHSLCYDYLYPNPSSVLAFIENHDTSRFLGKGKNVQLLKQALALLLTVNRIPQLYYGTELLMNGTTEETDGDVRKDFPGGFMDDEKTTDHGGNGFCRSGRSRAEQSMFAWLSRLLHWRQQNEIVIKGRQIQFIPYKGVYVIARQYKENTVLTVLNGTNRSALMDIERYREIIKSAKSAVDVLTGKTIDLSADLQLKPRQSLVLEF
jgi:glycosidase